MKPNKTTILIVEDEIQISYMLSIILEDCFDEIIIADNGKEGLSKIEKYPNIKCILSDINMPEMDGITMMKKIRETNPTLPVIFFTAYGDNSKMEELAELNAHDVITKPEFDNLEEIIKNAISNEFTDEKNSNKIVSKYTANYKKK